ncbi:Panacea domain-containing protein [Corynebacterium bovis]|uniref:Panacea domain-containing protein n=1 Tax=Corynebacterium bovis TaxID=36808 RepID=UPI0024484F2D|nr:Panacea domain-containing protein [Corynebacterium bovis]MDH2456152.1 Panacea domain-containing protein [Corynebacterium bovis]
MIRAIDVGQYIYSKLGWVDAWRLQKLTYYAQAWTLAWSGHRLIEDDFQAWRDGPVAPRLHRENKYSRDGLTGTCIPDAHPEKLSDEQKAMIDAVIEHYGSLTKEQIVALVHEEAPWKNARGGLPADAQCDTLIDVADMRRYYAVQQFSGGDVPTAPGCIRDTASRSTAEQQLATMMDNRVRWADALELLADR